ncbi:Phosphatidylinositol N-acetylglucosaminyltransferase subunit Y [Novymonas esmeraldas]|uniref:Phosphatidylinositol N-acetylglucosaminyltransferase subunit Y n=1 Tax=Novymonas esmeraldas TaxID=1808958 RepID=A0AAW0EP01_9TRYP
MLLDVPDYRRKPFVRFIYAWPAFLGIVLFTTLTFGCTVRCILRSLDGSSGAARIGTNSTNSVRQDIFYVVAAPLIFQGLCVSIYTTWMSWKFFRHN